VAKHSEHHSKVLHACNYANLRPGRVFGEKDRREITLLTSLDRLPTWANVTDEDHRPKLCLRSSPPGRAAIVLDA